MLFIDKLETFVAKAVELKE
jgi:hypothetical protein